MKALVGAFNQEKALVGAFSVIVKPVVEPMDRFTALHHTYIIYWHNLWDDGGVGHGRQQGRLGGPRPRARAHHLGLGRRVRRVLRGAVEDLHNRGMYFIEMKNML